MRHSSLFRHVLFTLGIPLFLVLGTSPAWANVSMLHDFNYSKPSFTHDHPFAKAKVVLQVSQAEPARWNLTLNNAQNLLNYFGQEQVQIVVVAFGPGIKMYLPKNKGIADRIAAINAEGVEFDVCHNSMEAFKKKTGHLPKLDPSVVIVPAGIVRIMQLEHAGFAYVKP